MSYKQMIAVSFFIFCLAIIGTTVFAASVTLQNPGFESPVYTDWQYIGSNVQGWDNPQSNGFYVLRDEDAPEGRQCIYGLGWRNWLTQTIANAVQPNTVYTLKCKVRAYESTYFVLDISGNGFESNTGYVFPDRNWHTVTLVYATGSNVTPNSALKIGCCYDASSWGDGVGCVLDDFQLDATTATTVYTLQNPSFELPVLADNTWVYQSGNTDCIQGWRNPSNIGLYQCRDSDARDGRQYIYGVGRWCWLAQSLGNIAQPNTKYFLSCKFKAYEGMTFWGGFFKGDQDLSSGTWYQKSGLSVGDRVWHDFSCNYATDSDLTPNSPLTIGFTCDTSSSGDGAFACMDDVHLLSIPAVKAAKPVLTPASGTYSGPQSVTISCNTPGATICYTTDGTEPTEDSTRYTGQPISATSDMTIKAKAFAIGYDPSPLGGAIYAISPTIYRDDFSGVDGGLDVRWSEDATNNLPWSIHPESNTLQGPMDFASIRTTNFANGNFTDTTYTVSFDHQNTNNISGQQCALVLLSQPNGVHTARLQSGYMVDFYPYSNEVGYVIEKIGLDGSTSYPMYDVVCNRPASRLGYWEHWKISVDVEADGTCIGIVWSGKDLSGNSISYATSYKDTDSDRYTSGQGIGFAGWCDDQSSFLVKNLKVTAGADVMAPIITPNGSVSTKPTNVTISCPTSGAQIHYTTDGTEPTESSALYTSTIVIPVEAMTIKAKAFKAGSNPSVVTSATFNVLNRPAAIPYGDNITVDGNLSDWAGSNWTPLDVNFGGNPTDIAEAYYSAKWGQGGNKIYVAAKVRDLYHVFTSDYGGQQGLKSRDALELFIHTTGNGTAQFLDDDNASAQYYSIGIKNGTTDQVWTAMGWIYQDTEIPSSVGLQAAGKVDGDWIYYEMAVTPFEYLGALRYPEEDNVVSTLHNGDVIGLDVVAVANSNESGTPTYTGRKAEQSNMGQWNNYLVFGKHVISSGGNSVSIADIKNAENGSVVSTSGSVVTAVFPGFFYIEDTNRTNGVRVEYGGTMPSVGQVVNVNGTIKTLGSGERCIGAWGVDTAGAGSVGPIGMNNKALGGGGFKLQSGVKDGMGLNNIGLLVKAWGRVTSLGDNLYNISDGSGVDVTVKLFSGTIADGSYVTVKGISSCLLDGSNNAQRMILVSDNTNITSD